MSQVNKIGNNNFYIPQKVKYPPFVNGDYIEEYVTKRIIAENPVTKRKFIPAYWTNVQINQPIMTTKKKELQDALNNWVKANPSPSGYFAVVQHADGIFFTLPPNTLVFGCSKGDIILPLIYEDNKKTLESIPKFPWKSKKTLCSFVGSVTANGVKPNVRKLMIERFDNRVPSFKIMSDSWKPEIKSDKQDRFIKVTQESKFALAPRGYGRTSFRLYEILKMGVIPIYLWNDVELLPYLNPAHGPTLDYSKFMISIKVTDNASLDTLPAKLAAITEEQYNNMLQEYKNIEHVFYLPYIYDYIIAAA